MKEKVFADIVLKTGDISHHIGPYQLAERVRGNGWKILYWGMCGKE